MPAQPAGEWMAMTQDRSLPGTGKPVGTSQQWSTGIPQSGHGTGTASAAGGGGGAAAVADGGHPVDTAGGSSGQGATNIDEHDVDVDVGGDDIDDAVMGADAAEAVHHGGEDDNLLLRADDDVDHDDFDELEADEDEEEVQVGLHHNGLPISTHCISIPAQTNHDTLSAFAVAGSVPAHMQ